MHKNRGKYVVDFACAKSRHIGILHNLTDMRRKPSASLGLRVAMVPVPYHQMWMYVGGGEGRGGSGGNDNDGGSSNGIDRGGGSI
jgi:hypothetical protein